MAARGNALLGVALAAALYLFSRGAGAYTYADGTSEVPLDALPSPDPAIDDPGTAGNEQAYTDMEMPADMVDAFLYMIMSCEHSAQDVASGDAFRTFFGGAKFNDMSDHPVLTGELKGVPLPYQMCINAGIASGNCVSTAAGAFQANVPTWNEIRDYGGTPLPDFGKESQLEFGRRLLAKIGALPLIIAGDILGAIRIAGKRWASLPGAVAKQGQRSQDFALAKYNDYMTGAAVFA